MSGWAILTMPPDVMQPGGVVHVVPTEDAVALEPANGHELHPLCWCHPVRVNGPLEDPVLSHNDPTWPGADPDLPGVLQT
jgi:hypothetical protein